MTYRISARGGRRFVIRVCRAILKKIADFLIGVYNHTESIIILVLASIGLNSMLGELPFYYAFPIWIEISMVIPVAAILIISMLVKSAEFRHLRRMANAGS